MGAPEKYERDFVERAVRMYRDRLAEGGDSKVGARRHVGSLLDLNPATLRNWVEDEERRHGVRPPTAAARAADSEDGKSSAVQDAVAAQSMSPRLVSLWPSRIGGVAQLSAHDRVDLWVVLVEAVQGSNGGFDPGE